MGVDLFFSLDVRLAKYVILSPNLALFDRSILVTVGISSLAIITWAIIKMVAFAKFYGRIILATVFVVLSIEMVSALRKMTPKQYIKSLRLIYCSVRIIFAVDPFQIHGLYSASMNLAFIDNSLPLVNISAILMILYWNEMMNTTSLEVNTFISKMRIPFIILSALIAAIHILRTILSQKLHIPAVDIFNGKLPKLVLSILVSNKLG
jgi:hypothetical protein